MFLKFVLCALLACVPIEDGQEVQFIGTAQDRSLAFRDAQHKAIDFSKCGFRITGLRYDDQEMFVNCYLTVLYRCECE